MNNTIKNVALFLCGVAVGYVGTVAVVKKKYDAIVQEEVNSVREVFFRQKAHAADVEKSAKETKEYADIIKKSDYCTYSDIGKEEKETTMTEKPYVISPDVFGEEDDYDQISLTYYSDGVLADDMDEIIEDVDDIIGSESLDRFGEYDENALYVRNDRYKAYYEILRDSRSYTEVRAKRYPYPMEEE